MALVYLARSPLCLLFRTSLQCRSCAQRDRTVPVHTTAHYCYLVILFLSHLLRLPRTKVFESLGPKIPTFELEVLREYSVTCDVDPPAQVRSNQSSKLKHIHGGVTSIREASILQAWVYITSDRTLHSTQGCGPTRPCIMRVGEVVNGGSPSS